MAGARRLENEIRVGLEQPAMESQSDQVGAMPRAEVLVSEPVDPLEVVSFGKTARRHVREFGSLFATICFGIAAWKMYRGHDLAPSLSWLAPGIAFAGLGWFAPRILMPVWRGWMKFAHYLSIVMTAVLLSVTWCLGFLPMALILRVVGIRRIDMSFRADRPTYWEERDPKYDDFQRLRLQY